MRKQTILMRNFNNKKKTLYAGMVTFDAACSKALNNTDQ